MSWPPPTSQSTYSVNRSYSLAVYISVRRRRKSHYTRNELRRVFAAKTAERNSECIGRRTEGPKRTPVASASNLCWLIVAAQTGRDRHTIRTDRQTDTGPTFYAFRYERRQRNRFTHGEHRRACPVKKMKLKYSMFVTNWAIIIIISLIRTNAA